MATLREVKLPAPLRAALVEALARLLVADVDALPGVPLDVQRPDVEDGCE